MVEQIEVRDILIFKGRKLYFIVVHPVTTDIAMQVEKQNYKETESFVVDKIDIALKKITMRIVDSNEVIEFSTSHHPENIKTYERFISEREIAQKKHKWVTINPIELPAGKHNNFLYEWLHLL